MARTDFEQLMNHSDGPSGPCQCGLCTEREADRQRMLRESMRLSQHSQDWVGQRVVQVDAHRTPGGQISIDLSVDGGTVARVLCLEGCAVRLGSGHELVGNIFEKDGLG